MSIKSILRDALADAWDCAGPALLVTYGIFLDTLDAFGLTRVICSYLNISSIVL
jgi:hypothetical protein